MEEIITEKAIQMVIMDAIQKGHTNANELKEYMNSKTFAKSVANYVSLFNEMLNRRIATYHQKQPPM